MIGFVLAELRDWSKRRMAKMITYSAIGLALAAFDGPLQPLLVALACTTVFLFAGWVEGNRLRSTIPSSRLLSAFPTRPRRIIVGKAFSLFMIWIALVIVFSPLLAATVIAWGLPGPTIANCLLCWLLSFMVAGAAGFISSLVFKRFEGIPGLFMLAAWIILDVYAEGLRMMNPFFQTIELFKQERSSEVYLAMGGEAVVALLLFSLSGLAVAHARKDNHG